MDEIASRDPSPTKKYTPWMVKQTVSGADPNDLYPSVAYFHRHIAKFEKRDINAYRTAKDLEDAVKAVDSRLGSSGGETSAKIIAEDGPLVLEWLEKKQDAWRYTNSSRWCITQRSASYFEQYTMSNIVFYVIRDRTKDPKDPDDLNSGFAYAISVQRDMDNKPTKIEIWKQEDKTISPKRLSAGHQRLVNIVVTDAASKPKDPIVDIMSRLKSDRCNETDTVSDEDIERLLSSFPESQITANVVSVLPERYMSRFVDSKEYAVEELARCRANPYYYVNHKNPFYRTTAAYNLDKKYVRELLNDPDKGVMRTAAFVMKTSFNDDSALLEHMHDEEDDTRLTVAMYIDSRYLPQMMNDKYHVVRMCVAGRVDPSYLETMLAHEQDSRVIKAINERLKKINDEES